MGALQGKILDLYDGIAGEGAAGGVSERVDGSSDSGDWIAEVWKAFPRAVRERFKPVRVIGEGGMGIVLEAEDTELARVVAIKGLKDPRDPRRQRLAREARITARLTHPNILPVFDVWTDAGGNSWCSMLRVPGEAPTLTRWLERLSAEHTIERRPLTQLFETFLQICRAVSHAHSRGVVHRDLKPDNILLGPTGEALVADWGLASTGEAGDVTELVGTKGYAAPEQLGAFGAPRADARSDVFSLGVILYELVVGRRHSDAVTWAAGWGGGPPRPQLLEVPGRVPRELGDIIRRAAAWEPEERFADVDSLRRAIEAYLTGGLIEGMQYTRKERLAKWARAHPARVAAAVTALLFSGALARTHVQTLDALGLARRHLAVSHAGWAEEALGAGRPEIAEVHAALALRELPGEPIHSGVPYSILAGERRASPLLWAATLDAPGELARFAGDIIAGATRGGGWYSVDLATGRLLSRVAIPKKEVWGLAQRADGGLLATVGGDKLVCLWETQTGRQLAKMEGHTEPLWAVAFSPDGKLLATGGHDRTVRLWDVGSARQVALLQGHTGQVWCVAFSPDGKLLASGDTDRIVRVWDVAGRKEKAKLEGHQGPITGMAFTPDSRTLATGSDDRHVRLWALAPGGITHDRGEFQANAQSIAFSPDGVWMATSHSDYTIRLWHVPTRGDHRVLEGHTNWISALDFSRDGKRLVSTGQDSTVRLWDLAPLAQGPAWQGHSKAVTRLAVSPDNRRAMTSSLDGTLRLWSVPEGLPSTSLAGYERLVQAAAFDRGGRAIAAGSTGSGETIEVRYPDGSRPVERFTLGKDRLAQSLAFDGPGRRLGISATGGALLIRELDAGVTMEPFEATEGESLTVALSPDGKKLASGGTYRAVLLWDAVTGRQLARLEGHEESVEALAFTPNGRWLASGGQDFTIWLWEVGGGHGRRIGAHTGHVWSLAFAPGGELLASGGLDGKVRLWRVPKGEMLAMLDTNDTSVTALAFTPDGRWLISAGGSRPQRWDVSVLRDPAPRAAQVLAGSFFELPEGRLRPVPKPAGRTPAPRGADD